MHSRYQKVEVTCLNCLAGRWSNWTPTLGTMFFPLHWLLPIAGTNFTTCKSQCFRRKCFKSKGNQQKLCFFYYTNHRIQQSHGSNYPMFLSICGHWLGKIFLLGSLQICCCWQGYAVLPQPGLCWSSWPLFANSILSHPSKALTALPDLTLKIFHPHQRL